MARKVIVTTMISALIWSGVVPALAAEETIVGPPDLVQIERILYGESQQGALLSRLEQAELEIYGRVRPGSSFPVRLQRLVNQLTGADSEIGLRTKLNAIEWVIFRKINEGPSVIHRLEQMEEAVYGETKTDTAFANRLQQLLELMWPGGKVYIGEERVPAGTLVKVELLTELHSEKSKADDVVGYVVVEDVTVNHKIAIAAGTTGEGRIISVDKAGRLGRDGKVHVDFGTVSAMDATAVKIQLDTRADERNRSLELAAGASIAGAAILGPLGLAAGLFVTGKESVVPAGSEFYVEVAEDVTIDSLSLVPLK